MTQNKKEVKVNKEEVALIQERYMRLQTYEQQLKKFEKQYQVIEQQLAELDMIKEAVNDINDLKKDTEIYAPISSGIFVKAKISDPNDMLVNVGSGVSVKKDAKETKSLVEGQHNELSRFSKDLFAKIQTLMLQMSEAENELRTMLESKAVKDV